MSFLKYLDAQVFAWNFAMTSKIKKFVGVVKNVNL
jgi:hypothetical protein